MDPHCVIFPDRKSSEYNSKNSFRSISLFRINIKKKNESRKIGQKKHQTYHGNKFRGVVI
jgi:hypothetical protein